MFQLTTIDGRFQINGKEIFLRAGEYHYFRIDPEFWERDLEVLRDEGRINTISSYVPWIFHEISEGNFDFDGKTHPRRNLKKFLDICRKLKLPVIFRPGPFIYSEYPGFGIPLWIGEKYPEVVVKTVDGFLDKGLTFYNISLNHPKYLEFVRKWYSKIKDELTDYFENPIIIFQLDNETGLMYNFNVGRIDFNPETINSFHQWLEQNFGDPQTLSIYCIESYLSFDEVQPPISSINIGKSMIWQSFFEDWVANFLEQLREMVEELDIPLIFSINEQGNYFNPTNPIKKAPIVEIYGYNVTMKTSQSKMTHDVPFGNSIIPSIFKGYLQQEYQPLFASEMGCGWFDPRVKVSSISTVQLMMGSIAHGAKGITMYVTRDGEDINGNKYYYRGMLNNKSKKLKRFTAVSGVFQFVEKLGRELLQTEEIYDEISFATYAMNHRTIPGDMDFGRTIQPIKIITMLAEYGIFGMLLANGYNPRPIALERVSLSDMKKFKTIFFHNRGAIDKADYTKLLDYVKNGGHLVTGPNFPVMNEYGFPLNTQKLYPAVVSKQRDFGRHANLLKLLSAAVGFRLLKKKLVKYNENALYHLEQSERLNILRSWRPWGVYAKTDSGRKLHLDYFAREFMWQMGDVEPILKLRNKVVGYRNRISKGTNTVIGTPLGARYVIDAFYKDSKKIKEQNKAFLQELFAKNDVQKTFDANVELEIVGRCNKEKQQLILFLLNRGRKKEGVLRILIPAKTHLPLNKPLRIEILYSYFKSQIAQNTITLEEMRTVGIKFKINRDDCLVLRFSPFEQKAPEVIKKKKPRKK